MSFSHVNGLSIYQAKKIIGFLFGKENIISYKKDERKIEYIFYLRKQGLNEKALKVRDAFHYEFDRIKIELIETE